MKEMRGPPGNGGANQRLAWEQKNLPLEEKRGGNMLLPVSKAEGTRKKLKTRWPDWQKQQKRCFQRPPTPPTSPSKNKGRKTLRCSSSCPLISFQFLSPANPDRNCWHRGLLRKEVCKCQLFTRHSKEGKGEEWIWGQIGPGSAETSTLFINDDGEGRGHRTKSVLPLYKCQKLAFKRLLFLNYFLSNWFASCELKIDEEERKSHIKRSIMTKKNQLWFYYISYFTYSNQNLTITFILFRDAWVCMYPPIYINKFLLLYIDSYELLIFSKYTEYIRIYNLFIYIFRIYPHQSVFLPY